MMSKRRGRRPIDPVGSVQVGVTFPLKQFEEFCRLARQEGVSVPEIVRRIIRSKNIQKIDDQGVHGQT